MTRSPKSTSLYAVTLLAVVVLLGGASTTSAQRAGREKIPTKTDERFLRAFREVVVVPSRSTVRLRCREHPKADEELAAFGAVVGADGWILTKASQLKGTIVCELHDGREFPARLVGVSKPYDLAMLKVEVKGLKPVEWRDSKEDAVGSWVATPGMNANPVAVGVLSVSARKITGAELARHSSSGGFLGIRIAAAKKGVKIAVVLPGGAADKAKFAEDDIIVALGKTPITDPESLLNALEETRPGQIVTVRVKRGSEEVELTPKLRGWTPDRTDFQNQLGSKLSHRRTRFPVVLQHDTVLRPVDCGGPLVDLDGKVIGINIARAGRTESYAIPAEAVKPLLDDLKSGKLAPAK